MPSVYLVATINHPSPLSCYIQGERVRVNVGDSIPFVATKSNGTTFFLRHLDHFVEEEEFHDVAISIGLTPETRQQVSPPEGMPLWGKIALGVGALAAVAVVGVAGYKYINKEEEKSVWDELNPWYKKPTLKQRIKGDLTKATDTAINKTVTIARAHPTAARLTYNVLKAVLDPRSLGRSNITSVYDSWTEKDNHRFTVIP
jgi:hypothetical protein